MRKKVGLLTSKKYASYLEEDQLLLKDLETNNIDAATLNWDNANADLKAFDLIIVRTVWDYFQRYNEFSDWLSYAEAEEINLLNDIPTIRNNIHKFYLKKLGDEGVQIIPSLFFEKFSKPDMESIFNKLKTDIIILKPAISGGAYNLFKADRGDNKSINKILNKINDQDFIVQTFMNDVKTEGEISLVFFNNEYSHSVRKIPGEGDFRVQGGDVENYNPDSELIKLAEDVLFKLNGNTLYARIDCFYFNKNFYLVEAELFEPQLFTTDNKFRKNFVDAILKRLK
ncbi:MAG: hypothetical protein M3R36_14905 [Bacteroidota bacterium]|nr:hypothetical protein [Bacteroidota bacterium]